MVFSDVLALWTPNHPNSYVAVHIFVTEEDMDFKFDRQIDHNKSIAHG